MEIKRLGGKVWQYRGDGVLAYLEYLSAHEDDAKFDHGIGSSSHIPSEPRRSLT
jgi:hypothetical protein